MNTKLFIGVAALGFATSALAYADSEGYPQSVARPIQSAGVLHDHGSEATPLFDGVLHQTYSNFAIQDSGSSNYQNFAGKPAGNYPSNIASANRNLKQRGNRVPS